MAGKGDIRRPATNDKGRNNWYDKVDWDDKIVIGLPRCTKCGKVHNFTELCYTKETDAEDK